MLSHFKSAAIMSAAALALSGCTQLGFCEAGSAPNVQENVDVASALQQLEGLEAKGKAPSSGYSSKTRTVLYGPAWSDATEAPMGHDGCDTRNNILARDLHDVVFKAGTRNCKVLSGKLEDPYTGLTIDFTSADPSAVQIDHVVALENSWVTGAQAWDQAKRARFANDPANLKAVQGKANTAKGSADYANWQPRKEYRCVYAAAEVSVKASYGLWVTQPEKTALQKTLSSCSQGAGKP